MEEADKRRHGCSREHRPDCVQIEGSSYLLREHADLAAQSKVPAAWRLVEFAVDPRTSTFTYRLNRVRLKRVRRREGRYLVRTNPTETDPVKLWTYHLQLVQVEEAFRTLKSDLAIRPIFHQVERRIEAHVSAPSSPVACT